MKYSMNGVPAAAEINAALYGGSDRQDNRSSDNNIIRLSIDAALKNIDGDTVARMVQEGFSEIAVSSGGKVFEY